MVSYPNPTTMNEPIRHFNLRVYGLILDGEGSLMLTDEFRMNRRMTKFPGGGMHFGEGTLDCLHREMIEEFGQDVEVIRHFYTTDFFQKALFFEDHQLISIYYLCRFAGPLRFRISEKPFDWAEDKDGNQCFRWVKIAGLDPAKTLSFPVDQHAAELLRQDSSAWKP